MDKLEQHKEVDAPGSENSNSNKKASLPRNALPPNNNTATIATSNHASSSHSFSLSDDAAPRDLGDDVDVMIRIAFIEFLFSPEILGLIEKHLCVFRLFPRPVVTLKQVAFLSSYEKTCSNTDKSFIKELIRSQVS